jgi:hypothetical protein
VSCESKDTENGIAFWLDGSSLTGEIVESDFVQMRIGEGRVLFMMDGEMVRVHGCQFECLEGEVANSHPKMDVDKSNLFGVKGERQRESLKDIGFQEFEEKGRRRGVWMACAGLALLAAILELLAETVWSGTRVARRPAALGGTAMSAF